MATGREEGAEVTSINETHTLVAVSLGGLFISFDLEPVWREWAKRLGVRRLTVRQKQQVVFEEAMERAEDVGG